MVRLTRYSGGPESFRREQRTNTKWRSMTLICLYMGWMGAMAVVREVGRRGVGRPRADRLRLAITRYLHKRSALSVIVALVDRQKNLVHHLERTSFLHRFSPHTLRTLSTSFVMWTMTLTNSGQIFYRIFYSNSSKNRYVILIQRSRKI